MAAPAKAAVEFTIEQQALRKLSSALRKEADGKQLRKDLIAELKTAVAPAVSAVQGKLRSIPHNSATTSNPPLGTYLAQRVKPQVKLTGRTGGVKVRIPQTPNIRGFKMAARRLNRHSWRHKVFGHDVWVTQLSPIPGYFDDTMRSGRRQYRAAVLRVLEQMARRIRGGI